MIRRFLHVLYLLALPLLLVGQSSAQVQFSKSVTVEVRDAFTDEAIVGAPVLLRDTQAIQSTNSSGRVKFTGLPLNTSQVTFYISPRGYAPGLRVITTDRKRQTVIVQVVPGEQYKTPLISAATGGSYFFSGLVHPDDSRVFDLQIIVPANALAEDAAISFTPYPAWTNSQPGRPSDAWPLGMMNYVLRNPEGDITSGQFALPIEIRLRPWTLLYVPSQVSGVDPSKLSYYRYDPSTGQFAPEDSKTGIDPSTNSFTFQVNRFSIHMACLEEDEATAWTYSEGQDPPPANPPVLDITTEPYCDLDLSRSVLCGATSSGGTWGVTKGTTFELSASLSLELEAHFGAKFGNKLAAEMEAQIGRKITLTAAGKFGTTTTKDFSGSVEQGGSVGVGTSCHSGDFKGYSVYDRIQFKINGSSIGSWDTPTGTADRLRLTFAGNCPGCGELAFQPPIDTGNPCD